MRERGSEPVWGEIFALLEAFAAEHELPSVSLIGRDAGGRAEAEPAEAEASAEASAKAEADAPFLILISTVISLRTRDEVTLASSRRLFEQASTPGQMLCLSRERIEELIYPCGFYRMKAGNILEISRRILEEHGGRVPSTLSELLAFPGVGLKTANLVLGLGFGIPAICVDTHVHRIANRMGWIQTVKPDDSAAALEGVLPREYWIPVNRLLVLFGQNVCGPGRPWCSRCPLGDYCPQMGVEAFR